MGFANSCLFKEALPIYLSVESMGRGPALPTGVAVSEKHVAKCGQVATPIFL